MTCRITGKLAPGRYIGRPVSDKSPWMNGKDEVVAIDEIVLENDAEIFCPAKTLTNGHFVNARLVGSTDETPPRMICRRHS